MNTFDLILIPIAVCHALISRVDRWLFDGTAPTVDETVTADDALSSFELSLASLKVVELRTLAREWGLPRSQYRIGKRADLTQWLLSEQAQHLIKLHA